MAEIIKTHDLSQSDKLMAGYYNIDATAISTGLKESVPSEPELYVKGEDLFYAISDDGEYYVVKGRLATATNIVIPDKHDEGDECGELDVREIAESAFEGDDIVSVTIPASVKRIGRRAFAKCGSLETVTMNGLSEHAVYFYNNLGWTNIACYNEWEYENPQSVAVENVGNGIFRVVISIGTSSIYFSGTNSSGEVERTLALHANVHGSCWTCGKETEGEDDTPTYRIDRYDYDAAEFEDYVQIEEDAFNECVSLVNLDISNLVSDIGSSAFFRCEKLEKVSFSNDIALEILGDYAFASCYLLKTVGLPSNLRNLNEGVFYDDVNLENIIFGAHSMLGDIGNSCFARCSITSLTIPENVSSIGTNILSRCEKLERLFIANKYGWYYISDYDQDVHYVDFRNKDAYQIRTAFDEINKYYLMQKIFEMPAPTISISNLGVLTMTDKTGLAEKFRICAVKKGTTERIEVAVVNVIQ